MEVLVMFALSLAIFYDSPDSAKPVSLTYYERCNLNDEWKRYGTVPDCISEKKLEDHVLNESEDRSRVANVIFAQGVGNALAGKVDGEVICTSETDYRGKVITRCK